jgi:hypothetical protein
MLRILRFHASSYDKSDSLKIDVKNCCDIRPDVEISLRPKTDSPIDEFVRKDYAFDLCYEGKLSAFPSPSF